jgi:hypothetical protein
MREFLFCMFYKTIGKFYIKIPNRLKWSSSDFKIGKKWALGKPHPNNFVLSTDYIIVFDFIFNLYLTFTFY